MNSQMQLVVPSGSTRDTALNSIQPSIFDITSLCSREPGSDAGNAQEGAIVGTNDRQPFQRQSGDAHSDSDLLKLLCTVCRTRSSAIHFRLEELNGLVRQLRTGKAGTIDPDIKWRVFNGLELTDHDLITLFLSAYNMTLDELTLLKNMAESMGADYPAVTTSINSIAKVVNIFSMQPEALLASLLDAWVFAVALPILDTIITPFLIENMGKEQVIALIKLAAAHRQAIFASCDSLVKKIIGISNAMSEGQFGNDDIQELLSELIKLNGCDLTKHLLGCHRFSHKFVYDDMCAIIEQYAINCTYSNESFLPLLAFLVNGGKAAMPFKDKVAELTAKLYQRNNDIAITPVYWNLQRIAEKCKNPISMHVVSGHIANALDGTILDASEDLFCAFTVSRSSESVKLIASLIRNHQDAAAVRVFRRIPTGWISCYDLDFLNLIKLAIEAESFAVLEDMLVRLMHTRCVSKTLKDVFKLLLCSSSRDHVGLVLRIISYSRLYWLKHKEITDWLLKKLIKNEMYWCIPYLKNYVQDRAECAGIIESNSSAIMTSIMTSKFQFSELFCKMIRYDTKNTFFVEHLPQYLEALLGVSTSKCIIQRLLIEIPSTHAFRDSAKPEMITAVYELFKKQADCCFYLDAFYYALPFHSLRICLKGLIIDELCKNVCLMSPWAIISSRAGGVLHEIGQCAKCGSCGHCFSGKDEFYGCRYCALVHGISFGTLLTALKYAQSIQ